MDEMELMMHLHRNNKRQGPGSEDATNLAVTLAKIDREKSYKIADIGCGTGEQTISLAKMLKGNIIAVDLFEEFLEKLKEDSKNENITAHIETLAASMDKLSVSMTGQNSVMDWGLWLLLIGLVALYFWLAFRRRK